MQVVEMLQREMKKERIIGRRLGLEKGREEGREMVKKIIKNMKNNNLSLKKISLISGLNDEEINEILKK